jgi:G3E family GTPase
MTAATLHRSTGVALNDVACLHNLVTVVDAAAVFEQLGTVGRDHGLPSISATLTDDGGHSSQVDTLVDRGWHAAEGDARTVSHLLCDQLEFADLLLVNKCDLVTEAQRGEVEAFLRKLNPSAELVRSTNSVLPPAELLGKARLEMRSPR